MLPAELELAFTVARLVGVPVIVAAARIQPRCV
jgi:hypothetical protein